MTPPAGNSVPPEVEQHAPLLYLHPKEVYGPVHPDVWLEGAKLLWHEGGRVDLAADPARKVFAGDPGAVDFEFRGHRLTDLTRPWESARPSGDRLDSGFALTTATDPKASFSDVPEPVPVFYEHVEGEYVTYWLFYPWSTVPRKIPGPRGPFEDYDVAAEAEDDEAALALLNTYPELVRAASPPTPPPTSPLEGLELPSPRDLISYVRDWIGDRWPVLHEGDWEGLVVSLAPERPRVAYFQHGRPQERPLRADKRPEVYVALGSHASYPDVDAGSSGSPRVKRVEQLAQGSLLEVELIDVRAQRWYGFGGAWGAPGRMSDETGPLGPGEAKGPRPFAAAAGGETNPAALLSAEAPFDQPGEEHGAGRQ